MIYVLFSPLLYMDIAQDYRGYKVPLIRNPELVKRFHEDAGLIARVGLNSLEAVIDNPIFYYAGDPRELDVTGKKMLVDMPLIGINHYSQWQVFIEQLWFIKDCSVNIAGVYIGDPDQSNWIALPGNPTYYNAHGDRSAVKFSTDELNWSAEFMTKIFNSVVGRYIRSQDAVTPTPDQLNGIYHSKNRLEGAFFWMLAARKESYLPKRLVSYLSIVEALFGFQEQKGGVTKKIIKGGSEYIGKDDDEVEKLRSLIDVGYDMRSCLLHGRIITMSKDELKDISAQTDQMVRRMFLKLMDGENYKAFL